MTALVLVLALTAADGNGPVIDHRPVTCLVAGTFPRLDARFEAIDHVARARVRFRPSGGAHWYSVAMTRRGDAYVGVLPRPTPRLHAVDYYIEATATDFSEGRTPEQTAVVVAGAGACRDRSVAAAEVAAGTIAVDSSAGAPVVPEGFTGIGSTAATAAAAGAAAGGGATTLVIIGAVAAGAAVGAAAISGSDDGPAAPTPGEPPVDDRTMTEFRGTVRNSGSTTMSNAICLEQHQFSTGVAGRVNATGTFAPASAEGGVLLINGPVWPGGGVAGSSPSGGNSGTVSAQGTMPAGVNTIVVSSGFCSDSLRGPGTIPFSATYSITVIHPR